MKISKNQLQKIIAEEVREHVKKKLVSESKSAPRTVKATPSILKRIIAEEASKFKNKPVKATPEMLKRIIAEEAARVNEMHDEDGRRHPDDAIFHDPKFGGKYSDESYEALQDEYAEDAAREEAKRKREEDKREHEPLYLGNMAFIMLNPRGRLVDLKTKEVLLDLSYGAYTTGTGAPVDEETMRKIKCVSELRGKRDLERQVSIDRYLKELVKCLQKYEIIPNDKGLGNFRWED